MKKRTTEVLKQPNIVQKLNIEIQPKCQVLNSKSQEHALNQVIKQIFQTLDIEQIFSASTKEIRQLLQSDRVSIFRFAVGSNYTDSEVVTTEFLNLLQMDRLIEFAQNALSYQRIFGV